MEREWGEGDESKQGRRDGEGRRAAVNWELWYVQDL